MSVWLCKSYKCYIYIYIYINVYIYKCIIKILLKHSDTNFLKTLDKHLTPIFKILHKHLTPILNYSPLYCNSFVELNQTKLNWTWFCFSILFLKHYCIANQMLCCPLGLCAEYFKKQTIPEKTPHKTTPKKISINSFTNNKNKGKYLKFVPKNIWRIMNLVSNICGKFWKWVLF